MLNEIVCKECRGSKNVAFKRDFKEIEDTGLTEMTCIPESPEDYSRMTQVLPETMPAGYVMDYEWCTVSKNGKDVKGIRIFPRKLSTEPGAKVSSDMTGMSKAQLIEMAVMAGIKEAEVTWSRARLIGEIEKAKVAV